MLPNTWRHWLNPRNSFRKSLRQQTSGRRSRLAVERLEDRTLMAIDLAQVGMQIGQQLSNVENALSTIDNVANQLPIVNQAFSDLPDVIDVVKDLRKALKNAVEAADSAPELLEQSIREQIYEALGEAGLEILSDRNGNFESDPGDVGFELLDGPGFEVKLDLEKTFTVGDMVNFGLGLDGIPFEVSGDPGVQLGIAFSYDELTFGWKNDAPFFEASTANELKIGLTADVTGGIEGIIGFFNFSAEAVPAPSGQHHLGLFVTMDVADNGSISNPTINGTAEVTLALKAEFTQYFPSVGAELHLHWDFINTDPKAAAGAFGGAPVVELNHVSVGLGSLLSQLVGPIVDVIQPILEPIQPVIDTLQEPIPVLSDLSTAVGGPVLTALELVRLASDIGVIPEGYQELTDLLADVVVPLADLIGNINAEEADNLIVDFGSFNLTDIAAGKDLRLLSPLNGDPDKPLAENVKDLTITKLQDDFTSLLGSFDFAKIEALIDELPDAIDKQKLKDLLKTLNTGVSYEFPVLDNPLQGVVSLFLGNDVDLFKFTAQAFLASPEPIEVASVDLPLGLEAKLTVNGALDSFFQAGYDTRGLRRFVGNTGDPSLLLDGFWLSEDNKLLVDVGVALSVGIEYLVFSAGIQGGVFAGLHTKIPDAVKAADVDGRVHILSELGPCMFEVDGALSFGLSAFIAIGVELPLIGFVGFKETFDIASIDLISFSTGCTPNPFVPSEPVQLAGKLSPIPFLAETQLAFPGDPDKINVFFVSATNGILNLNVGDRADQRNFADDDNNVDVAEVFVISHVEPDPAVDPPNVPAGEIITVSAFGVTERYYGVKEIHAKSGDFNDTILIKEGVKAKVTLNGGAGNDKLTNEGSGDTTLSGGVGDDVLIGGTGKNTLNGGDGHDTLRGNGNYNELNGGDGDDNLEGSDGQNFLHGDDGNDTLKAAGPFANVLDGGAGFDVIITGLGDDLVNGGPGNDSITWKAGNGSAWIDGGSGFDSVGIAGTDGADTLSLFQSSGVPGFEIRVNVKTPEGQTPVLTDGVEDIALSGGKGADLIQIGDLTGTSIKKVGANLGDVLDLDFAEDFIMIGATAGVDQIRIDLQDVVIKKGFKEPDQFGGVMRAEFGGAGYTIYAANVLDGVRFGTGAGDDIIQINGVPGPTFILSGDDDDRIGVIAGLPDKFLGLVDIDAGKGSNRFEFGDLVTTGADIVGTNFQAFSNHVPAGVRYVATLGGYQQGVFFTTGSGDDTVQIQSTRSGATTTIQTGGGADHVILGEGGLTSIRIGVNVDLGSGVNQLTLDDHLAFSDNDDVLVTANQVLNFAGANNNTPVTYAATGGTLTLHLEGADNADLLDVFTLKNPAAQIVLHANAGKDTIHVQSLVQPALVDGGAGDDIINVGANIHTLNSLGAAVLVHGGAGNDHVNVFDQATASAKTYALTANTLVRSGAGAIGFNGLESMQVFATPFADTVTVMANPATPLMFRGGAGADKLIGPDASNVWQLTAASAGLLNDKLWFTEFDHLSGGSDADRFVPALDAVFAGKLSGGGGGDTLDYTNHVNPVQVNLLLASATGIGGGVSEIENVIGGAGGDILIGDHFANTLSGEGGHDILLGNNGADVLHGGAGRDILIGGKGMDSLFGGADDDILIGGRTSHDAAPMSLMALRKEWTGPRNYARRIAKLRNGGGLNGAVKLNDTTVLHDQHVDALTGGLGQDWFWAKVKGPIAKDNLLDAQKKPAERIN